MEIVLVAAFLTLGPTGLGIEFREKPMESMQECRELIRQEEFTNNMVNSVPDAVTVVFDCLERELGQEI